MTVTSLSCLAFLVAWSVPARFCSMSRADPGTVCPVSPAEELYQPCSARSGSVTDHKGPGTARSAKASPQVAGLEPAKQGRTVPIVALGMPGSGPRRCPACADLPIGPFFEGSLLGN